MIAERIDQSYTSTKYYQFTTILEHMLDCFHTIVSDETNPYHPPLAWLTRKQPKPADAELFLDLMDECSKDPSSSTSSSSSSCSSSSSSSSKFNNNNSSIRLSSSVRSRLERYSPEQRQEIVSRKRDGCSPLFMACKNGLTNVAKYLIDTCNASLEEKGRFEALEDHHIHSVSPIWVASVCCHLETVGLLIERGANVNSLSDTGSTPLRSVCFLCQDDDDGGSSGQNHQDDAFQANDIMALDDDDDDDDNVSTNVFESDPYVKIVKLLVKNGADIGRANYHGGTCLINSLHNYKLTEYILDDLGADINAADNQGKTALHYAIQQGRLELVKLLIRRGADPSLRVAPCDDDALQLCCIAGHVEIFDYLRESHCYSAQRLADAYKLLGSSILEIHYDLSRVRELWKRSLVIQQQQLLKLKLQLQLQLTSSSSQQTTSDDDDDDEINFNKKGPAKHHENDGGQLNMLTTTTRTTNRTTITSMTSTSAKIRNDTCDQQHQDEQHQQLPAAADDVDVEVEVEEFYGNESNQSTSTSMDVCDTNTLGRRRLLAFAGDIREFSSESELEGLTAEAFRMQSLLISERVLGSTHRETIQRLLYRGTFYINSLQPNRCIDLWIYALKLRLSSESIFHFESIFAGQAITKLFVDLLSQTSATSQQQQQHHQQGQHQQQEQQHHQQQPHEAQVKFGDVRDVLVLLLAQLDECKAHLSWKPASCLHEDIFDLLLRLIVSLLLVLRCLARSPEELNELHRLIGRLVELELRSATSGSSLLHICLSASILDCEPLRRLTCTTTCRLPADRQWQRQHQAQSSGVRRVVVVVVEALLEAGHPIDPANWDGLTPLQCLCLSGNIRSADKSQLIHLLVERGAHVDRRVPAAAAQEDQIRVALREARVEPFEYVSLACLAARQVARHKRRLLPPGGGAANCELALAKHLRESIEIH